jgi:hypothetical protein
MTSYLLPPEIDACTNMIRGYVHTSVPTQTAIQADSYFLPMYQVTSQNLQLPPSATRENNTQFTVASSRVLMQFPPPEQRTSKINNINSDGRSKIVLPHSSDIKVINSSPQASYLGVRSQSTTTRVIPSSTITNEIRHTVISNTIASPTSLRQFPSQPIIQPSKESLTNRNVLEWRPVSALSSPRSSVAARPVSSYVSQPVQRLPEMVMTRPPSGISQYHPLHPQMIVLANQ